MLRQIKPRNSRSKRALEKRAPKAQENPKTALFLRGTSCSQVCQDALGDLCSLRAPQLARRLRKKNAVRPFEDDAGLCFLSEKNDASLAVLGSSSKKRRHCLTLARLFGHRLLDMLELCLDETSFRRLADFKTGKFAVGLRPMLVFAGTAFESPVPNEWTLAKSLLTDLLRGDSSGDKIDVEGLQYVVVVTADEGDAAATGAATEGSGAPAPAGVLRLRVYRIRTVRSGQRLPRVEIADEIGPRMDFRLGRARQADAAMLKEALKKAKTTEERTKKNIATDLMGDKIGRIHLARQDLGKLQTRKMKGLKRRRGGDDDGEEMDDGAGGGGGDGGSGGARSNGEPKKARR